MRAPLLADVARAGARRSCPGRLLLDIVRHLPAQHVSSSTRGGRPGLADARVRRQRVLAAHLRRRRLPAPRRDRSRAASSASSARPSSRRPSASLRAASRDDSRPVLTGVLVEFADGVLTMAATDSYRMAVRTTTARGRPARGADRRSCRRARSASSSASPPALGGDELEIVVEENQVLFGIDDVWLGARRIEGQFPKFRRAAARRRSSTRSSLPRAEFADVIARVELLAAPLAAAARASQPGELTVSAQTQEVGEGRESLPCDFRGEPLEIGFNAGVPARGRREHPGRRRCSSS